jgi:hypothetical protein
MLKIYNLENMPKQLPIVIAKIPLGYYFYFQSENFKIK